LQFKKINRRDGCATRRFLSAEGNFSRKFWKKPLAVFLSWGIFLPVAGDDRDNNRRQPLSSGKSKAKTKIKIFEKSS
jgi:hypothetical protein